MLLSRNTLDVVLFPFVKNIGCAAFYRGYFKFWGRAKYDRKMYCKGGCSLRGSLIEPVWPEHKVAFDSKGGCSGMNPNQDWWFRAYIVLFALINLIWKVTPGAGVEFAAYVGLSKMGPHHGN